MKEKCQHYVTGRNVTSNHLLLEVHTDARLRELNCGNWAGLTEQEIEKLHSQAVAQLRAGQDIPRGGGETMADVERRIHFALADWVKENFSNTLLVISHAYVIRAMTQILLDNEESCDNKLPLPSLGSYTLLKRTRGDKWLLDKYGVVPDSDPSLKNVQWLPTL